MSENFRIIYKILKILESSMDCEGIDTERLSPSSLGITEARFKKLLKMLLENGFVSGFDIKQYIGDSDISILGLENIEITLKGLEYLEENSLMKKAANLAKGIVDTIK